MADQKPTNRERVKEIVDGIEQNIQELFQSERYFDYLRTMSRFHSYSVNNTILIHMQRPNAVTPVAGFNKWKQFGRHVKKGEKGLTIIAPTPLKKKIEEMKLDPDTKAPVLDQDGNAIIEEKTIEIPLFKPVKVFSADQTDGKPLPSLVTDLTGDVQQYEAFMEALRRTSPVPVKISPLEDSMDGFFSRTTQSITVREGMSEVQTVCATVHEIAHAVLHNKEQDRLTSAAGNTDKEPPQAKDKNTMEVEAESVSFAVCQYYGIDTASNSIGYIAGWSKDRSLPELKASLETITRTVGGLISAIDKHFAEICKERGIDLTAQPEIEDSPEKFVSDLCGYLCELQEAGLIPVPTTDDLKEQSQMEAALLPVIQTGQFSSFEHILDDVAQRTNMPTTAALRERLEKLSDQWDAALVCKIEPFFGADSAVDRSTIQTYQKQGDQLIPHKPVFVGTMAECQRVMDGLEAGTITMRQVRQPDFEPPEPKYVYKMEANLRTAGTDDRHFIQAYEQTAMGTLIPEQVLFLGNAKVCTDLLKRLNDGTIQREDFFVFKAAQPSNYAAKDGVRMDALVGLDDKIYLGRSNHHDNCGHYLNDDKSLTYIGSSKELLPLLSGDYDPSDYYVKKHGTFSGVYTEFSLMQHDVLADFVEIEPRFSVKETPESEQGIPLSPVQSEQEALPDTKLDEYPLPEPLCQADELEKNYGYMEGDLLPLGRDRAVEMLDQDFTVYAIVDGGSAEMVFDREDLEERPLDARFAVSKEEWEDSPDFQQAVADRMQHQEDREQAFLDHGGDCFAIYQVKDDPALRDIRFEPMDWLKSKGQTVERENYDLVYTAPLPAADSVDAALDQLWYQFNNEHPADYRHPSMSVSDIVAIRRDGVLSCHYCDSFGFQQLPDFIKPENYLKNAEMAMEDDYGMIDGIINNGSKATVAELEQQARNGQPISLMDLADAVHRERGEKKSVLAKLNDKQPKQERKKSAQKKRAERER